MAVYQKLLLSTGGGIISSSQQAEQAENTATVLIGLGGTGVDCIRTIKTQVYTRLKADDEKAVVPTYQHIRFIGVDTTPKSRGGSTEETEPGKRDEQKADALLALDDTEFYDIGNKQLRQALAAKAALKMRNELSWLRHEDIDPPDLGNAGAGGIRQIGRFMMMDKSQEFMAKLETEINAAKLDLQSPSVNVHIFAGLSGGTGSGCFLDVCYMVRSIAERIPGITIFGYFFLPDVNLQNVPAAMQDVRNYIPKNGYAAMQELDYCMGLPGNGGSFEQIYKGHKTIKWNTPPVDMCHLICATDQQYKIIPKAYNYAMNVTAEYIMDFLTKSNTTQGLAEHLSNFRAMIGEVDERKTVGSEMAYCVIGASCASIPLREINTYLASELFGKFGSIKRNMPSKEDVEQFAITVLARDAQYVSDIYDSLYREAREDATGEYQEYPDDWKYVRDYGNSELVSHYTNQTAAQLNRAEANAKKMVTAGNQQSLLGRVFGGTLPLLRDVNRGPIFVYRMFAASEEHNFLNIIDGLIAENTSRWNQEAAQTDLRVSNYDGAKDDFDTRRRRSLFDSDEKRFNDYQYYLMLLEQHKLTMQVYEKLNAVLTAFRSQVVEMTASYYIKLYRVMDTLLNTFEENKAALANEKMAAVNAFEIPMMTIAELKTSLDAEIARINIPNMLDAFMDLLLTHQDDWIKEDPNKITRLVRNFFVETAFHDFASKTITGFLRDKYEHKYGGAVTDEQLTNYIYEDWMKKLTEKARPLFYFNPGIWDEARTSKLAYLSFPDSSGPIKAAAEKMGKQHDGLFKPKNSAMTDRIFVMCSACGLPLSSYYNCAEYERSFFSAMAPGRHYYEGKPNPSTEFTDWNLLPSITPQSAMDMDGGVPEVLMKNLKAAKELFAKARKFNVIDGDGYICEPSAESIEAINKACAAVQARIDATKALKDIPALKEAVASLDNLGDVSVTRTEFQFPQDGFRQTNQYVEGILEDHFVASPALHKKVAGILSRIEDTARNVESVKAKSAEAIAKWTQFTRVMDEYCDAMFTGVITLQGRTVTYLENHFGIENEIVLSKREEEFPFGTIPIYQAYISFKALPEETRKEIKKKANDRINADDAELHAAGNAMRAYMDPNRIKAMQMAAQNFTEFKDIVDFIADFNKRLNIFCLDNGL